VEAAFHFLYGQDAGFRISMSAQLRAPQQGLLLVPKSREAHLAGPKPIARPLFGRSTIEMRSACQAPRCCLPGAGSMGDASQGILSKVTVVYQVVTGLSL